MGRKFLPWVCLVAACSTAEEGTADAGLPDSAGPATVVTIGPEVPLTRDKLVATVMNPRPGQSFRWYKNDALQDELTTETVGQALTRKGEVWRVDLMLGTNVLASDEVTIENSPPSAFQVRVTPGTPLAFSKLRCDRATPVFDDDGDVLTYTTAWFENDAPFAPEQTTQTEVPNDTVAGDFTQGADSFRCQMTASDGAFATTADSPAVMVTCATGASQRFEVTGTGANGEVQRFTVPLGVCAVRIEAAGGKGQGANTNGATMAGTFQVRPGDVMRILVGQRSVNYGGGGGSFVTTGDNVPLLVAGGGGSNFGGAVNAAESQGRTQTSGGTFGTAARANDGDGGKIVGASNAGAGGGFLEHGQGTAPGRSFLGGGNGGGPATGETSIGGYGGGGARAGLWGEGGGGGYSGGSCGNLYNPASSSGTWVGCGGGGSFNTGTEQVNTAGDNAAHGYVLISW